jgi:hypothetical protein
MKLKHLIDDQTETGINWLRVGRTQYDASQSAMNRQRQE